MTLCRCRRTVTCAASTAFLLLSWLITCEPYSSDASNKTATTDLSDPLFLVFHACMLRTGGYLEDLAMNSTDVRSFVWCCYESNSHGHHSFSTEITEVGPDGRDLLSMSASEIQSAFGIPWTISLLIKKFIDRQLTSFLPRRRYLSEKLSISQRNPYALI